MKVLTVGSAMIDTIAIIESDHIERVTLRNTAASFLMLEEGRKIEALEVSTHCGGGAVNTAVTMARLGLDVAVLVKLGRDARAETILERLMSEGISARWVVRDGRAPTGASVHVSSHERNSAIFTFRGANTKLQADDLRKDLFAADMVYVASLSGGSAEHFFAIVEDAKREGAIVVANPGAKQVSGATFRQAIASIDILIMNRHEANALVPLLVRACRELPVPAPPLADTAFKTRQLESGGFKMDLSTFVRCVTSLGPRTAVLTDGSAGAFVATKDRIIYCPAIEGEVRGTAGAGDAFGATFAAFVLMGRSLEDAILAAAINAGSVTKHVDTQTGLLAHDVLAARMAEIGKSVTVHDWALA